MTVKLGKWFLIFGIFAFALGACSIGNDPEPVPDEQPRIPWWRPEREPRRPPPPLPRVGERLPIIDGSFTASGTAHGFASFPAWEWVVSYRGPEPGERLTVTVTVEDGWIEDVRIVGNDESRGWVWHIFEFGPAMIISMNEFALTNQNIQGYTDVITTATYTLDGINEAGNIALQKIKDEHARNINIDINKKTLSLVLGEDETLEATVIPDGMQVTWASGNEAVATVDQSGKVSAVSVGEALITATINHGEYTFTDSCLVEVKAP